MFIYGKRQPELNECRELQDRVTEQGTIQTLCILTLSLCRLLGVPELSMFILSF